MRLCIWTLGYFLFSIELMLISLTCSSDFAPVLWLYRELFVMPSEISLRFDVVLFQDLSDGKALVCAEI